MNMNSIRVGILGASGYTGAELLRLLIPHGGVEIQALTADRKAGEEIGAVFPHLAPYKLPRLKKIEDIAWDKIDAVFCALPHATTQQVVKDIPAEVRVIDLSADFRLFDPADYAHWYGHEHLAPNLQTKAVYALTEHAREIIRKTDLAACPGCYPTASLLATVPLVKGGLIDPDDIVIDAKSGVSGAGRALKEASLFSETAEGLHAYGVANHRHTAEIDQQISQAAGRKAVVNFTPHLVPMVRGIAASIYVRLAGGADAHALRAALVQAYADAPFVHVLPEGAPPPDTRHVRGTNHALISVHQDRIKGRAIVCSVIDNLVKGASGQAVQNMNIMFGFDETAGLNQVPLYP